MISRKSGGGNQLKALNNNNFGYDEKFLHTMGLCFPDVQSGFKILEKRAGKKSAFTLAEVLITLGVIGVVAAMTIPNLITNYQKRQLEVQIKGTYSTIQQAIKFADYEDISYDMIISDKDDSTLEEWFNTFLGKHLKVEQVCINKPGCWHGKGIVKDLTGNLSPWDNNNGIGYNIITFKIAKGAYFDVDAYSKSDMNNRFGIETNSDGLIFYFDANGDRKPNRIGKDIYIMGWTEKGLVPAGNSKSLSAVDSNCLNGNGYWCLQKVISSGWVIPDSVWKKK